MKPLFINYKSPLKDVSIIIYKILSDKVDWQDFEIDDNTKKKFSFFYEENSQRLIKKFIIKEKEILNKLTVINDKLIIRENKIKDEKTEELNDELKKNNVISLHKDNFSENKEWSLLNRDFQDIITKKNLNLDQLVEGLQKQIYNLLTRPYNEALKEYRSDLPEIEKDQAILKKSISKQKSIFSKLNKRIISKIRGKKRKIQMIQKKLLPPKKKNCRILMMN